VKVGDLVRIDPSYLREDESKIALITLYPDDEGYIFQEWGDQVAGECDCMVFWMGQFVPFHTDCFAEVISCVEDREV
jgi:hypothetical protein